MSHFAEVSPRRLRDGMLHRIKPFEAGEITIESNNGAGRVDTTQAKFDETKRWIAELDGLVACL